MILILIQLHWNLSKTSIFNSGIAKGIFHFLTTPAIRSSKKIRRGLGDQARLRLLCVYRGETLLFHGRLPSRDRILSGVRRILLDDAYGPQNYQLGPAFSSAGQEQHLVAGIISNTEALHISGQFMID